MTSTAALVDNSAVTLTDWNVDDGNFEDTYDEVDYIIIEEIVFGTGKSKPT